MKKLIFIIIVCSIFSGCSANLNKIEELEIKITELENQNIEVKELEIAKLEGKNDEIKELEITIQNLEEKINQYNEENVKNDNSLEKFKKLKENMLFYFEVEQESTLNSIGKRENPDSISIGGAKLFMTSNEVRKIYGDEYVESFVYENASGYVMLRWKYKSGITFEFNPVYLISIGFSNEDIESNLGFRVGSNASTSIEMLDSNFIRYTDIYTESDREYYFGYYYDEKSDTNIRIGTNSEKRNYDSINDENIITGISITDVKWDYDN